MYDTATLVMVAVPFKENEVLKEMDKGKKVRGSRLHC